MGSIGSEELVKWEKMQIATSDEEKILVLVRLRPLSEKEIEKNDASEWECINDTTILFRNSLHERSGFPSAYSFDRVFRGDCSTRQLYDEAAKEVALSVVGGINSTIFAYGQTSSGKTYTMTGITEYTVADIYDYMFRHDERAFALKFSAIEIYNEVVRDLLSTESTPLRILDDPEKGTFVEKLTEEILKDWNHLKDLLSICEAQRQTGETSLNETSSRSHQILKLTIESSAREFLDKDKSATLSASVNFVDLAGSERASQALSVGTRLKEGCHINRSLLTLGTVIRKLSKGRQGHINYRDSKLTRILQPSLGGNARTAIICTLCPARAHVEQSRNTLLFASCAKEVTTNAHVNVVMSDKALVKHLQKEVARLECELRIPALTSSTVDYGVILRKKDLQIDRMEKEIKTLIKQRNLAEARVEDLLRVIENTQTPKQQPLQKEIKPHFAESRVENLLRVIENNQTPGQQSVNDGDEFSVSSTTVNSNSMDSSVKVSNERSEILDEPDNLYKDVQCIEMQESSGQNYTNEAQESASVSSSLQQIDEEHSLCVRGRYISSCKTMRLKRSHSCGSNIPGSELVQENTPLKNEFVQSKRHADFGTQYKNDDSESSARSALVDVLNGEEVKNYGDSDITSIHTFVSGLKEMAELHYENGIVDRKVENDCGKNVRGVGVDPMKDSAVATKDFERQQKAIIELWHVCNVPLVHRTYFFLLFKAELEDSIYMEVEFRRLSFIREKISQGVESIRNVRREKEILCKLMRKRLTKEERERAYKKWEIGLESKRRRWQLVQRLWSHTKDMNHIKESAHMVAKLVGFCEQQRSLNESFGLSFSPLLRRRSFWRNHHHISMTPLS